MIHLLETSQAAHRKTKRTDLKGVIAIAEKYRGYVAIPQGVQVFPIWDNAYDTALWLYCVLHASHRPYGELRLRQFYVSQEQITVELHWTRKTVGIALQRLVGKALLDVKTSGKGTVPSCTGTRSAAG